MSEVYVSMAMSLDGFITGLHEDAQNPAGVNGLRLMDWLGGGGSDPATHPPRAETAHLARDRFRDLGAGRPDDSVGDDWMARPCAVLS